MNTTPRKPGRPRGAGKNDGAALDAVADVFVNEPKGGPKLRKTSVITRTIRERYPDRQHEWSAMLRRMLRKWDLTHEERLAAARERRDERRSQPSRPASSYDPTLASTHFSAIEHGAALRALGGMAAITQAVDSLAIGGVAQAALKQFESSAFQKALRQIDATTSGSSGVYGVMRRAQDEVERAQRLFDQVDLWRSRRP